MTTLGEVSRDLAVVTKSAGSAVVRVEGRRRLPATGVIWSPEGHILTADHVVRADEGIRIGLEDGRVLEAVVIGRDQSTDLALLKVEASNLAPFATANTEELAVGQLVLALGRPGSHVQATIGILSSLAESWHTRRGGQIEQFVQTDVLMYPGFSGGPLLGADGGLIGINSSALVQGISVTLPLATLQRVAGALLEHGRVRRGYLGVSTQAVRLPQPLGEILGQRRGLLIVAVEPGSPAEKGGLSLGDTIVGLGEGAIRTHDDLLRQLTNSDLDEKIPVRVIRTGELQTLNVKLGEVD